MPLLIAIGFLIAVLILAAWLRCKAFAEAISNPFDCEDHE
jgi:hypothetical protein